MTDSGETKPDGKPDAATLSRAALTLIAFALTAALVWNVVTDGEATATLALSSIVAFLCGFPVGKRFLSGGGD